MRKRTAKKTTAADYIGTFEAGPCPPRPQGSARLWCRLGRLRAAVTTRAGRLYDRAVILELARARAQNPSQAR
jgi:hypothetical protein